MPETDDVKDTQSLYQVDGEASRLFRHLSASNVIDEGGKLRNLIQMVERFRACRH
jgi:hypothetical protein